MQFTNYFFVFSYTFSYIYLFTLPVNERILIDTLTIFVCKISQKGAVIMKHISKKVLLIIVADTILYDFALLIMRTHFNWNTFLYYAIVLDTIILCMILPFLRYYKIQTYRTLLKEQEPLRLLYQAKFPDASTISEDELYDIINLRMVIPEHTCSKSDYIKYLKRKGLLIVNGQHIWLYGTTSNIPSEK